MKRCLEIPSLAPRAVSKKQLIYSSLEVLETGSERKEQSSKHGSRSFHLSLLPGGSSLDFSADELHRSLSVFAVINIEGSWVIGKAKDVHRAFKAKRKRFLESFNRKSKKILSVIWEALF